MHIPAHSFQYLGRPTLWNPRCLNGLLYRVICGGGMVHSLSGHPGAVLNFRQYVRICRSKGGGGAWGSGGLGQCSTVDLSPGEAMQRVVRASSTSSSSKCTSSSERSAERSVECSAALIGVLSCSQRSSCCCSGRVAATAAMHISSSENEHVVMFR